MLNVYSFGRILTIDLSFLKRERFRPFILYSKIREMQNSSEAFKSNFDYYQRIAHKKLSENNFLLDFPTPLFPAGAPFSDL
jgi:hypothetical protein